MVFVSPCRYARLEMLRLNIRNSLSASKRYEHWVAEIGMPPTISDGEPKIQRKMKTH